MVIVAEPHTSGEVWHDAIYLTGAAADVVVWAVGHSGPAALEEVVVGAAIGDDLIGAGEILQGAKVAGDGSGCGVEAGPFDFVGVLGLAGGHQQIAEAVGVVGDVAGLVAIECGVAAELLAGTAYAVD